MFFNRTFINIAILGDRRTGKSCYVLQLLENRFSEEYVKSKENERKSKRISYKERNYNLNINIPLSDKEFDYVVDKCEELNQAAFSIGCKLNDPFMTMAFLSLSVIPDLKITDKGVFDVNKFDFIDIFDTETVKA